MIAVELLYSIQNSNGMAHGQHTCGIVSTRLDRSRGGEDMLFALCLLLLSSPCGAVKAGYCPKQELIPPFTRATSLLFRVVGGAVLPPK